MPFRFTLDSILRYRKTIERVEEITLHKIVQEIVSTQQQLEQTEANWQSFRTQRDRDLAKGLPAIHLQELSEKETYFANQVSALRARLRDLESKRLVQLVVFQIAQQNREVLSEMRQQKHDSYDREQRRQEQKIQDDLFLSRMHDAD
jgi:flagellar export protein FliJ